MKLAATAAVVTPTLICVTGLAMYAPSARTAITPSDTGRPAVPDALPTWLAGHWEGFGFGGFVEETWTPPRDGTMLGTFRLSVGGKARLFEFMILSVEDGRPAIRVKHFNADASAWEEGDEWVTFPFERSTDRAIFFGGLSYELSGSDELKVKVSVGHADGTSEIAELRLRRASDR